MWWTYSNDINSYTNGKWIIFKFFVFWTAFEAFSEDVISLNVLKRVISQPHVIHELKLQQGDDSKCHKFLYEKGVTADFFTLIIQGKVEITVGQEQLTFEEGPFTSFGTNALVKGTAQYIPDYTVRAVTDITYLKITRGLYKQAVGATLIEREQETSNIDAIIPLAGQQCPLANGGPEVNSSRGYLESAC